MKNINAKRKILAFMLMVITLASVINSVVAASPLPSSASTSIPVISLGSWSLGDTFEMSYNQENFRTYSYSDVQNLYNTNSIDAQNNEISLQSNDLQYQQYCLQYNSICDSIASYKQLVDQYKALTKTYEEEMNASDGLERDTALQNMQQSLLSAQSYETELASAILQKAEIYVNRENCLFINNNAITYRNQQYISQITDFRNSVYELKLLDEKYDLQGTYAEYSRLKSDEQGINKSKDLSFQTDVDFYSSDFDYYINQQELIKQQFNNQFEELLNNSNITTSQGTVINSDIRSVRTLALKSYATVESDSNATDIKKKQLEDKLRIIDGKITILKEYYSDTSNKVKLAQNEKSQASLELSKWFIQRKNTLKNAYAVYMSKYNEVGINEKKAKAQYEKYIILLNKYNYGLSNRITVKEAELNYMQSKLNAWNTLYEYANSLGTIEKYMSGDIQ